MGTDKYNEQFSPESVDEQVDQFSRKKFRQGPSTPSTRVVRGLHSIYQEDEHSLQEVWGRLADHMEYTKKVQQPDKAEKIQAMDRPPSQKKWSYEMKQGSIDSKRTVFQRLAMIAAVLLVALLVGSMLVVFNAARQQKMGTHIGSTQIGSGGHPMQVIYHTHAYSENGVSEDGSAELIWSPDGTRIAELTYHVSSS